MKFSFYSLSISFLCMSMLAGCGAKPTTTLEISRAFTIAGGVLGGGMMVYGENSATGEKVVISIKDNKQKTLPINKGLWTFYAIGWDGSATNTGFFGVPYCGKVSQDTNVNSVVPISVTTAGCSEPSFFTDVEVRSSYFIGSSVNKVYEDWNDAYVAPNSTTLDLALSKPGNVTLNSELVNYRIAAYDILNGNKSLVFTSQCFGLYDSTWTQSLPMKKFPLEVRAFATARDCNENNTKFAKYEYNQGIFAGSAGFDDDLQVLTSGPRTGSTRIVLPSGPSKRFYSPFLDMMPNILCGPFSSYNDCLPDLPSDSTVHVKWDSGQADWSTVYVDPALTTCFAAPATTNIPTTFTKFWVDSCRVDKGRLQLKMQRNELMCNSATLPYTIIDITSAGGYTGVLRSGVPNKLYLYAPNGKSLGSIPLSTGMIALASFEFAAGNINFYILENNDTVYRYSYIDGTGIVNQGSRPNLDNSASIMTDISASANTDILYSTSDGKIGMREFINNTNLGEFSSSASPISQIHAAGSNYFFIQSGAMKKATFTSLTTGTVSPITTSAIPTNLTSNATNVYVSLTDGNMQVFNADMTTSIGTNTFVAITSGPHYLAAFGTKVRVARANSLKTLAHGTGANLPTISENGSCYEIGIGNGYRTEEVNEHFDYFKNTLAIIGKRKGFSDSFQTTHTFGDLLYNDGRISSGGILRRVQERLSPADISGFIGEQFGGASCTAITTAVNPASSGATVFFTKSVFDPMEGVNFNIDITVSKSLDVIPDHICVNNNFNGTGCSGQTFDLQIAYLLKEETTPKERAKIKLKCGSKLGSFESYEYEGVNDWSKELIAWNTHLSDYQRFESYSKDKKNANHLAVSVTKFQKSNANAYVARTIGTEQISTTSMRGHIVEIERDQAPTPPIAITKQQSFADTTWSALLAPVAATDTSFSGDVQRCANVLTPSKYSPELSCLMAGLPPAAGTDYPVYNSGVQLRMDSLDLSNTTTLDSYFSLPIP